MAHPVYAPRVNNNDDTVKITRLAVGVGDFVRNGDLVLEVETEKAVVAVEAEGDGYVLALRCAEGDTVPVGDVAVWLGDRADEAPPELKPAQAAPGDGAGDGVTGKARLLLSRHGLTAGQVPHAGPRLTAADVEAFIAGRPEQKPPCAAPPDLPAPADLVALRPGERGALATVSWQRDHAATDFLEIEYDPRPWQDYAKAFAGDRRLLLNPMLALMAHRLALLAAASGANGTILEGGESRRARYRQVNLGFTVQAGEVLYLCVVERADSLDAAGFVARLGELQRRAMAHRLAPAETSGATVGFTSMARWGVHRHMPVLAPYSAVMVAHGESFDGGARAIFGATYDHRLLSGFDAARLLKLLADPAGDIPKARS